MLSHGGEEDWALKIDAIMDCCNDVCLAGKTQIQGLSPCMKGKRLSEATLTLRTPCQELDDICYENNWSLPTYHVSPSDGGFLADVTIKGVDFECSAGSSLLSNPREARESAATQMIAKLQSMAGQTQ
ncbi:unnamed protein product [Ilex paraguariensis]|uniref:DRBM domain-containing protein n=1 Tax=Ilex paraguariensis TaxID=185542 RepID=A0ABC8SVB6_9AQUA